MKLTLTDHEREYYDIPNEWLESFDLVVWLAKERHIADVANKYSRMKVCAASDCDVIFDPSGSRRIYCSKRCTERITRRNYRARKRAKGEKVS